MTTKAGARHPETLALHGGQFRSDPVTSSVAPPIYLTTSYQFRDNEHARRLFALEELGYTYTRTINPTREFLERRVAALEGGVAALALATGIAASLYALLNLARAGDNVVISAGVASGRNAGLLASLRQLGVEARLADPERPEDFLALTDGRTRAYHAESLSLPDLRLFPIAEVARLARGAGVPLLIDNSALPLTCRPFELGAAVAIYSAAEYFGGHATTQGGLIVDSGQFRWEEHAARFPTLTEPDESYHGVVWTEVVKKWGAAPFVPRTRARLLRDLGAAINPMAVFQLIQGVETLPLRIRRHTANAKRAAAFLVGHPKVAGLAAEGAFIAVDLPSAEAAKRFVSALWLFRVSRAYGDVRSVVVAPALMGSRALLSVGLEHEDDILADLDRALGQSS
jgi:O-acetylhomoserine (thiol)-lyase